MGDGDKFKPQYNVDFILATNAVVSDFFWPHNHLLPIWSKTANACDIVRLEILFRCSQELKYAHQSISTLRNKQL